MNAVTPFVKWRNAKAAHPLQRGIISWKGGVVSFDSSRETACAGMHDDTLRHTTLREAPWSACAKHRFGGSFRPEGLLGDIRLSRPFLKGGDEIPLLGTGVL
jgi:hypothetical protein